jgi:uncharacterized protein YcgL (UPF0745 family)
MSNVIPFPSNQNQIQVTPSCSPSAVEPEQTFQLPVGASDALMDFMWECQEVLSEEDYAEFLDALSDENFYNQAEPDIQSLVNTYTSLL